MAGKKMRKEIREYWESRAKEFMGRPEATTNDVYLRELEINTTIQTLNQLGVPKRGKVLDVGCGDGYSTLRVAEAFPERTFTGIDYSENMIKAASGRLASRPELKERVSFVTGDVIDLAAVCGKEMYDFVLSDRCLINLETPEKQSGAIAHIAGRIRGRGYYLAIENFAEGQENMNNARRAVGLPEIEVRWHNLYFKEKDFIGSAEAFFDNIEFRDFSSSYYFATRVIYSAMCRLRGEEPDYNHEIHRLAVRLPWAGQFSPIRLAILRRKHG